MEPLKQQKLRYSELPETHQNAIEEANQKLHFGQSGIVEVETYKTTDIKTMVEEVWKWDCTLETIHGPNASDNIRRVKKIMELIPKEGAWPYVSKNIRPLQHADILSVPSHGDGWHRIIAHVELGLSTIDIVFVPIK